MERDEADTRIRESRRVWWHYHWMLKSGDRPSSIEGTLRMVEAERGELQKIAAMHEGKRHKIERLCLIWSALAKRLREKAG